MFFLELAALMNVTKWIYYFLIVQTHRNIREKEITLEVYADFDSVLKQSSDKLSLENTIKNMLGKLKKLSCKIYKIMSAFALIISSVYIFLATKLCLIDDDIDKS